MTGGQENYPGKHSRVAGVEGSGVFCKELWNNNPTSRTTDEVMSTYTRRRHSPHGQYSIAGKMQGNVYTQAQHGVVLGRRADGVNQPFPKKPVSHRRPFNPRTQDSIDLHDFEKITITKQPRGPLSPQEHHPNGIRKTTASQHPGKDSHRLPRGELQMAKAIHEKKLMLQEKLWTVEEKIRQKIQRDSVDDAAGDDQKNEEERGQAERGKAPIKTRLSEQQRREPVRGREMMMQEKRQDDVKQRQDQRYEDRIRNAHEEEARWTRREIEVARGPQLQRKGSKETYEISVHGQEVSGELNKSRWGNVKKHTLRRGGDEKDNGIWGEAGVKSKDGIEKAGEREQTITSMGDKGWKREKKYRESTCKEMYGSDEERDKPQMSRQITSHTAATENPRGAGRKLSGEPLFPPVFSPPHSVRSEREELRRTDSTYDGLQLLPCRICNRKFASERVEMHVQICKKAKQSHRQVFNSYVNRTKGSAIEEFWKTHSRAKTPEVFKKKNLRPNHKANTRNLQEGRLPAGTSQPKRYK